jgi:hypothetical protein
MVRSIFVPLVFAVVLAAAGLGEAAAQFGGTFNDAPRPPADVPGGLPPRYVPGRPGLGPSDYPDPSQGAYPDPRRESPDFPAPGVPSAVQSEPLPPPPGTEPTEPPPNQPAMQARPGGWGPPPALAPGQRPHGPPQPANTDLQPGDEIVSEPPAQKIANPKAVFSGLDKITGRTITFDVAINETVQFGALRVTPRVCYTRPPTEAPNTDGFVQVDEITLQGEERRLFTGWMFAASPGLHAVEHPIYDVWLVDCKGRPPALASDSTPPAQPFNAAGATAVDPPATAGSSGRASAKPKH